ncbi:GNAT family N-acetyltransferase [Polaribacter sp.]|uniref:GNAT family N-acetyltransferase n=1 Tax=Polaribacter sp. TaxID=1920175 RepID=UPI003F6BA455
MTIQTFDAFNRLSLYDITRITNFLHIYSGDFKDTKSGIRKSLMYAAKEIPGLGGAVFLIENDNEIIAALVINKTGMNEYISENLLVNLAVKDEYRKKGIAKKLITYAKDYCIGDISLHINKSNTAMQLFEKEGFKETNIEMRLKK